MLSLRFLIFFILKLNIGRSLAGDEERRAEHGAILALKTALYGESSVLGSWNDDVSYCDWGGVACDADGLVVELQLSELNISGTIPPAIGVLRNLVNISVASNNLNGSIPPELSSLSRLRQLNLSINYLSGPIPASLALLRNLQVLDLYANYLNGTLPPELTGIPYLRHLNLGGNLFHGRIPPEFGSWNFIEYLGLHGNALSGLIPPEIGNLTTLQYLHLGYTNAFEGGIPPEFGNLTHLIRLDMATCGISGEIPPELGRLRNLDSLFLQANGLTGSLSPELGGLTSLMSLDLSNNSLSGVIPASFYALRNLTLLSLFINTFHGVIPEFISDLPELEVLQLWNNSFTGEIPARIGTNRKLLFFDVSSNRLTGTLPNHLCAGNRLRRLIAENNMLTGALPESLGRCASLNRMRMKQNFFTGSIPRDLFSLPNLDFIELQDNHFSGGFSLPVSSSSPQIGYIDLSRNRLSGPLPATIGHLTGVQRLFLGENKFSGQIMPEIGALKNLSQMNFSDNKFSGTIPREIGLCGSLTLIDLSRNDLTGEIPSQITALQTLNYLNLSRNRLAGEIPDAMAHMKSLTAIDFSYNNLSGTVSSQWNFNSTSFVGNPNLCQRCEAAVALNGHHSSSFTTWKLVLVIVFAVCFIQFSAAAAVKARTTVNRIRSRNWKIRTFRGLKFSHTDIVDCLKDENIIGRGGAGVVYRAALPDGVQVAVKRVEATGHLSAEIKTLHKIRHRHIVRLLGYCSKRDMRLLIYEFMPNGSLGEFLHGNNGGDLNWEKRYIIAVQAALGLSYLHHDCSPMIVHRDVKSNNILLDSDLHARVADFGLAKFLKNSDYMSAVAGTFGYIAPGRFSNLYLFLGFKVRIAEYARTLKVDEKSDVYSFGVVLLELVSGRKALDDFGDDEYLVQWVKRTTEFRKEEVVRIIDTRLPSDLPMEEVKRVFFVALLCVAGDPSARPTMREVVHKLTERDSGPSPEDVVLAILAAENP